jgi:hypothetical protein
MSKLKIILNKQLSVGVMLASVLLLGTIIGFSIHLVFAWSGPVANPPNQNIAAPITTAGGQTISGNLTLSGDLLKSGADGQLAASLDKVFIDTGDSYLRLRTAAGGSTYADFAANTIYSNNRTIQLGGQYLVGDNSSILDWKSNNSTITVIRLGDLEGTYYGRVYGSGDGAYFGLLDGDGQWSYMATNNTSTDFRIDGISELTITPTQIDVKSNRIINVATPTAASDAATKAYVDALAQGATAFRYAEGNTAPCPVVAGLTLRGAYYWDGLQNRPGAGADCAARQTCICFYSSL